MFAKTGTAPQVSDAHVNQPVAISRGVQLTLMKVLGQSSEGVNGSAANASGAQLALRRSFDDNDNCDQLPTGAGQGGVYDTSPSYNVIQPIHHCQSTPTICHSTSTMTIAGASNSSSAIAVLALAQVRAVTITAAPRERV